LDANAKLEIEKAFSFFLTEMPIKEETLMHIVLIGLYYTELPVADALDILEKTLRRAATFQSKVIASDCWLIISYLTLSTGRKANRSE